MDPVKIQLISVFHRKFALWKRFQYTKFFGDFEHIRVDRTQSKVLIQNSGHEIIISGAERIYWNIRKSNYLIVTSKTHIRRNRLSEFFLHQLI